MTFYPVYDSHCNDCGTSIDVEADEGRCPACFDRYLYGIDAGFLESYRRFGCRSRVVVAEACLRSLVLAAPEHRKMLAMTIFEQYVHSMHDLAGLFLAFKNRDEAPILRSFMEFRLDAPKAGAFVEAVQSVTDVQLCESLGLPLPGMVPYVCTHLDKAEARSVAIAVYHLVQDLRRSTDQGEAAVTALAQLSEQIGGAVIANDARWLNGAATGLTPDQVAMLVLDSKKRTIVVQGLTADEGAMGRIVDAIDTATRASSNLIFAYLQAHDL